MWWDYGNPPPPSGAPAEVPFRYSYHFIYLVYQIHECCFLDNKVRTRHQVKKKKRIAEDLFIFCILVVIHLLLTWKPVNSSFHDGLISLQTSDKFDNTHEYVFIFFLTIYWFTIRFIEQEVLLFQVRSRIMSPPESSFSRCTSLWTPIPIEWSTPISHVPQVLTFVLGVCQWT